jgi:hypothetical protein
MVISIAILTTLEGGGEVVDEKDLIAFLCKLKLDFDCINNNEKQSFVTVEKF